MPGDPRILRAVEIAELTVYFDVIVFPANARVRRPIPNMIAGSDLDGDEFWVWYVFH